MRWNDLFGDLEAQLEDAEAADLGSEVADRTRREVANLQLVDRLLPVLGASVRLQVWGAGDLTGVLQQVGMEMVLLESAHREILVPSAAILSVRGATSRSAAPESRGLVFERVRLASAIRAVARDRTSVQIALRNGESLYGTIDRVGADFLELAEHPMGEDRRPAAVSGTRLVPLSALGALLSS